MLVYIDSNVFIYAGTADDRIGAGSRGLFKKIIQGSAKGITASLTFDEAFYQLSKHKGRSTALVYCENFLALPNVDFLSVDRETISKVLELLKNHNLEPRDAIHAAVALIHNANLFVTEDAAFSKIAQLKVVAVEKALAEIENQTQNH